MNIGLSGGHFVPSGGGLENRWPGWASVGPRLGGGPARREHDFDLDKVVSDPVGLAEVVRVPRARPAWTWWAWRW